MLRILGPPMIQVIRAMAGAAVPNKSTSMAKTESPFERRERMGCMNDKDTWLCKEGCIRTVLMLGKPSIGKAHPEHIGRSASNFHNALIEDNLFLCLYFHLPHPDPYLCLPMETTEKRLPVSVYAESTPNPATMRFVTGRPLVPEGRLMEFTSPEEAEAVSPLAAKVFNLPFVTGVFISGNFITVTKNNSIDWDMVQIELREYIQEYLNTDGRVVLSDAPAQSLADANERAVSHSKPNTKDEEQIIAVLEEYVRPNVESDGGHIAFKSFKDGILAVSLRGSCSGCPSSMVTLKGGIENLMKQMVPGVREVVAEEL